MKLWTFVLAVALALVGFQAEAKRLGGGRSVGQQSSNVSQRQAAPATPAAPAAAPAPTAAPKPAAAPQPASRPWGAMLGGLAAGLGLAWLAHSLGMGEGMGQVLMVLVLAMGAMMLIGMFLRSRRPAQGASPYAFQGAGEASTPSGYNPKNVGNDASARPWESPSTQFEPHEAAPGAGVVIGSALSGGQGWGVPADFDAEGFLKSAKANFISLQAAWDKADVPALRAMMTDGMLTEIRNQLDDRETHAGAGSNTTEVVMIEAQLLGIEELGNEYMASVEFSGMIREDASAGPNPFREVWNMTKPKDGHRGWLVAGVQALQ